MRRVIIFLLIVTSLFAQKRLKHFDVTLPLNERIEYLLSRMTLEEKISQMKFNAPAIERLGIPQYNWWNECLHGVARNGLATVFPQAIGLAAMWDKEMMYKIATAISDEARAKYHDAIKENKRDIYQGLTFWSPNINIFRDPRWGRGMETYGEDPFLTGQMAIPFIKGLQGNDPKYFKTIATAKHFAVHSGPEPERHSFNAEINDYDLYETYLPAFKASVQDANVQSIMCAYNSLRTKPCCANDPLLENILRNEWGFKGYVVSDCWAISDIYKFHKQTPDAASASAISVKAGTDLECGDSYPKLFDAVQKGLLKEEDIDKSLWRLLEARFKLGMFDPDEMVPYAKITFSKLDSKENHKLALNAARKAIVLLKNQNHVLPLKKNISTIAVIGPNANDEEVLLGNYNGTPSESVTPLMGIKNKLAGSGTKIIYERGCNIAGNMTPFDVISSDNLFTSPEGKQNGLTGEYFDEAGFKGIVSTQIDKNVDLNWLKKSPGSINEGKKSIRWNGYLIPSISGTYQIGGYGVTGYKIFLDDSLLVEYHNEHQPHKLFKQVNLEANHPYKIKIEYYEMKRFGQLQLIWSIPDESKAERAIAAAKKSDMIIMFMGLSSRLEGEEMKVPVPGFAGGDRLTLDLPSTQENLIKQIVMLKKPVVLVLLNGSALSINWEDENIPAIIESWYGGQATGDAIADVLFGDYNPAGRLPITFYKSVNQLPDFKDYNMKGKTYRYFEGEPLYPFGYGLSYTSFKYSNIKLSKDKTCEGEPVTLKVDITNMGKTAGEEVVQFYVKGKGLKENEAIKSLKGFERIELKPLQTKTIEFQISTNTLAVYKEGRGFITEKGEHTLMVGSSSRKIDLKEINLIVE